MKTVYQIILKRRSIRRFKQKKIPYTILKKLVDAARLAPSAGNLQPLEYITINKKEQLKKVFSCLRWALYIHPDGSPREGRHPTAYIVVLINTRKSKLSNYYGHDVGAAVENIILASQSKGIGSCWLGSIDRDRLAKFLNIPSFCLIDSVVALGYPAESPKPEVLKDSVKYWLDTKGCLHVPKRKLKDIFHKNIYTLR
ncbi:MAG: nitroreductase family protein [Candidatus Omnitrophota bacterium]